MLPYYFKGYQWSKDLIKWAEKEMNDLSILFDESDLPDEVPSELIHRTLIKIRNDFYKA